MDNLHNDTLLDVDDAAKYLGFKKTYTLQNFFYASNKTKPHPTYTGGRLWFAKRHLDDLIGKDNKLPKKAVA